MNSANGNMRFFVNISISIENLVKQLIMKFYYNNLTSLHRYIVKKVRKLYYKCKIRR